MTDRTAADVVNSSERTQTLTFDDFTSQCCRRPHLKLLTDPDSFSLTQRVGQVGPVSLSESIVGSEVSMDCAELCSSYRVLLVKSGCTESVQRGISVQAGPGSAAVYAPEGVGATRWKARTEFICFKVQRYAVDTAFSDAVGLEATSHIEFKPVMRAAAGPARSWVNMLLHFRQQLFGANSLINEPLVGLPFAESLIRGFLLAADHTQRDALTRSEQCPAPRTIRVAVEIIEDEAHLPLTVSSIAKRSHTSVRALQEGFRRHLGMSPMAYLRLVRMRRAHQALLEADSSVASVAPIAYRWGFTNLGRFAAAHAARYGELPVETLRRKRAHGGA
jgi:AraC-like DNA-binding protein